MQRVGQLRVALWPLVAGGDDEQRQRERERGIDEGLEPRDLQPAFAEPVAAARAQAFGPSRSFTPSRSSHSSRSVATMRSRANKSISRPFTILYLPLAQVTGNE
jgi:hypothetical protein